MSKIEGNALPEEYLKLSDDIMASLQDKKMTVSDEFVLFIVRVVSLDPQNKFILKQFLEPSEIDRMKRVAIERILSMTPLARQIILMQLYYKKNYLTREELAQRDHDVREKQLKAILEELCDTVPTQAKHREIFYHKIVLATVTKMGIPIGRNWHKGNEYNVIQQTKAALAKIFPLDDMDLLNAFGKQDREAEIRSLLEIALGIRILNKEADPENAGAGLPDTSKQLAEKITSTLEKVSRLRNGTWKRLVAYTTVLKPFFLDADSIKRPGRRGITKDMLLIRQGLTMVHQLLNYIRILDQGLGDEGSLSRAMTQNFEDAVKDLKATLLETKSVPSFTIFPKFTELANVWQGMRDSLSYMSNCDELLSALEEYTEEFLQEVDTLVESHVTQDVAVPDPAEFLAHVSGDTVPFIPVPGALVRRSTFTGDDVNFLDTQYSGFCVWSLVEGLGMIAFSNPSLGLFHWNEKKYLISTAEAAADFVRDPTSYIHKAIHIALKWPELIAVLKMEDEVFQPDIAGEAVRETPPPKTFLFANVEIQTELHPIPENIVEGYSWNEWDYRRRALILSNVHKSATHSTQTYVQSINPSEGTQTYPLRSRRVQTNRSVHSEAPRNQFYFYGLRGHHCTALGPQPPHIVELSREAVLDMSKVKYPTAKGLSQEGLPPAEPRN